MIFPWGDIFRSDALFDMPRPPTGSVGSLKGDRHVGKCSRPVSTPAEGRSYMSQDRLDDMGIVGDAKLVRDSQE
jgi:hypothetical protein